MRLAIPRRRLRAALPLLAALTLTVTLTACGSSGKSTPLPAANGTQAPVQPSSHVTDPPAPGSHQLYVSPSGNDSASGSSASPFKTLGHALSVLQAGDVLVVGGGDYYEQIDVDVASGTATKPITVIAAKGERPVVHGLLWLTDPSWWRILGINVTWDNKNSHTDHMVKITGGHDWLLADAEMWNARSFAAVFVGGTPSRFELRNLYVHDTIPANGTNEDHLIYLNTGKGSGMVDGCLLVGSPNGRAIKVGTPDSGSGQVKNIVIAYNTMIDNLGPSNVQIAFKTSNVKIQHNLMVKSSANNPNITAFQLTGHGNFALDNLGWDSTGVVEHGVKGLADDGGNVHQNPHLGATKGLPFVPSSAIAAKYGCTAQTLAPGETSWCRILH